MSILSGYLVDQFGWRAMFIIEGIPAVILAVVWLFVVNDHPAEARWLSPKERKDLETAFAAEQHEIEPVRWLQGKRLPNQSSGSGVPVYVLEHRGKRAGHLAACYPQRWFQLRHDRDQLA